MKIIGLKGYHLALPKKSTTVIGGVDSYSGDLYRDIDDGTVKSWIPQSPHYGNVMTYFIKIMTDEGIAGYGEVESLYGARGMMRLAGENILGMDVDQISYIMRERVLGRGSTLRTEAQNARLYLTKEMLGIEFALWDALGKKAGLPVYNLLGGKVRKKVAITLFVGQKPIDECIADIDRAVKEGIRTIKLKAGANDRRDVELLKEVREQFGWDLIIRIDPNSAWGGTCDAVRILKQMAPYNLQYIEGALDRTDGESFKLLREMTGVPVCMCGEFNGDCEMTAHTALVRLAELVRMDAVDVLSVDPSRTGGLLGFIKLAAFCEGAGIEVVTHRARGSFSQAAWLTGCITSYSTSYAHDIVPTGQPSSALVDTAAVPLKHENGYMVPLDAPGWGLEPDWDVINKYCVGTEQAGEIG
jgi:L-alanine-DL-glutamate epimerase-like enolase superfamily enzyme